jgi:hypothetical protein
MKIQRREAVQVVTLAVGTLLSPGLALQAKAQSSSGTGPQPDAARQDEALLAEAADVIIPATDTPGAKAAGVEKFITRVLRDCHPKPEQEKFYAGLHRLEEAGLAKFSNPFAQLSAEQKIELMKACAIQDKAFFQKLKQLTVTAYFSSEVGATQALAYLPIPGRFEGSVPLQPGQKAWAL